MLIFPPWFKILKEEEIRQRRPVSSLEKGYINIQPQRRNHLNWRLYARTTNNQSLFLTNEEGIGDNPLWLEEGGSPKWERVSQDEKRVATQYGAKLFGVCSLYDLIICNGLKVWPSSGNITCHT